MGLTCPVCAATMVENYCRLCYYKEKAPMIKVNQPTERERLESKADFYLDNFYELESDELKMRYLVKICGGMDEVANLLFTHVYGLEDWDSFEDEQLEQLTENLESSYRELFDEEVEKEFVDQV